ncbi:uncharacterized protein LOC114239652 [Bombyx mandarina]|uniref:Uncharacterized protein LOC114239652 n=1 Tax=Bombyx mandarina TaxID=7092 RepID=A0A6J2J9C9_BOMMA|nr:uncharacterized protein LOC114239652 [Bombyx mandarina]
MAKCGACGKFLSTADCARCSKCSDIFHKGCVSIPSTGAAPRGWICPSCSAKVPRGDNTATPVRGLTAVGVHHTSSEGDVDADTMNRSLESRVDLGLEIRSFKDELVGLRTDLRECRNDIAEFKELLKSCHGRIDAVEARVLGLEARLAEIVSTAAGSDLDSTVAELRIQLRERDQDLLRNDIDIIGLPEVREESTCHLVQVVAVKLGVKLDMRDIVHAERIGAVRRNFIEGNDNRPRILSVRLARRSVRDALLKGARVRRNLSTTDLDVPGPVRTVYLNERLSAYNRKLFGTTRQKGKDKGWKYVWTKDGRIYIRRGDGTPALRIRVQADVEKHFGPDTV